MTGSTLARCLGLIPFVAVVTSGQNPEKELERALKEQYKGKQLSVAVNGLIGGESKKQATYWQFGVAWHHFHESLLLSGGKTILDQVDERTFATRGGLMGAGDVGLNTFPLDRGETLLVTDTRFDCRRNECILSLELATLKLSRASAMDPRKSTRASSSPLFSAIFEKAGMGCEFIFHFDRESIGRAGKLDVIKSTVSKYLLPADELKRRVQDEKNIEIEVGASEEDVLKKLGEPLKTIRFGTQKTLKYQDMTVVLKDGKVVDVKVE